MKNRKRFQQFMFSAIALSALIPLSTSSQTVHARANSEPDRQTSLINGFGLAPNLQGDNKGKGGKAGTKGRIGIWNGHNYKSNGTLNANYVHDHNQTGILKLNKHKTKSGLKLDVKAFGPTKSRWGWSKEGSTPWYVYTYGNNQSEKGKVGVIYKNALTYYPTHDKRYKKPVKLDARLVWNGSWKPNNKVYTTNGKDNIQFSTDRIAVKEPFSGVVNVTLQLYKAGTNTKFYTQSQMTQADIDGSQGIIFKDPAYIVYNDDSSKKVKDSKLNAGKKDGDVWWDQSTPGMSKIFGDEGHILRDKNGKNMRKGTIQRNNPGGKFTYFPKGKSAQYTLSFVHGWGYVPYVDGAGGVNNWNYIKRSFVSPMTGATGKTYSTSNIKHMVNNIDNAEHNRSSSQTDGAQADYFGYDFDEPTTGSYKITADKQVSTKPNHFKKADKKSNAFEVKNTQPLYFDIHTQLKEPSSAYVSASDYNKGDLKYYALPLKTVIKDADDPNASAIKSYIGSKKKNTQALVLRDYIDSRFTVEDAKVVYSKKWNDTHLTGSSASADKYFKVYKATATGKHKGQTIIDAVLRPSAMKAKSTAWMKDYHLIIKVKLKDNIMPELV